MPNYSDIVAERSLWHDWDPSYATILNAVGSLAAADRPTCMRSIVGLAQNTPTV